MITPQRPLKPVYGQGTVTVVQDPFNGSVMHDGQAGNVSAIFQYESPAVGDRIVILTVGRKFYATGKL